MFYQLVGIANASFYDSQIRSSNQSSLEPTYDKTQVDIRLFNILYCTSKRNVFLYSKSCPTPVTIGGALNFRLDGGQTHFRWAKNHPIPSRKAPAKMPRKGGFIPSLMLQKSIRLFQRLWYSRYSFTFTGVSNTSPGGWPWDF